MKKFILGVAVSLQVLAAPVAAQDTAPEAAPEAAAPRTFDQVVADTKTSELHPLLKINPATSIVIAELQRRAEAGDVTAMIRLGDALRYGNGVEKNIEAALTYYQMAAQTDSTWGLVSFGNALYGYAGDNEQQKRTAIGALQSAFAKGHSGAAASLAQKTPTDWTMYVQQQLVARGYYLGTPDGQAGPLTQNALRLFCEDRKVAVDCSSGIFEGAVARAIFAKFVAGE